MTKVPSHLVMGYLADKAVVDGEDRPCVWLSRLTFEEIESLCVSLINKDSISQSSASAFDSDLTDEKNTLLLSLGLRDTTQLEEEIERVNEDLHAVLELIASKTTKLTADNDLLCDLYEYQFALFKVNQTINKVSQMTHDK